MNTEIHVILDNVRSVFNVGSIFRTCDAVGINKLYLCGITPTPDNPKMFKTALGATQSICWQYYSNTLESLKEVKDKNIPVYGVELAEKSEDFQQIPYPKRIAVVFGHERRGVDRLVLDECVKCIYIPMNGIKESLNVANTVGIVLYEINRKR